MGWFDSWFSSSSDDSDPLRNLDPKLREFLERESPVKHHQASSSSKRGDAGPATTTTSSSSSSSSSLRAQQNSSTTTQDSALYTDNQLPPPSSTVPRESLYQDGRYAHLWKTYRPQAQVEAETKTDHEKLMDVLDGYKQRKAQIGRAALENCAEEQFDWAACMKSGDWGDRFTMCSAQVRKFERCYMVQSKLLKALGYLSSADRPAGVDEDIQLHADTLYHRMLNQEAAVEKAKAEGLEPPVFAPLVIPGSSSSSSAALAAGDASIDFSSTTTDNMPPMSDEMKKVWQERLAKLPAHERQTEEAAMAAELRAKQEIADRVAGLWEERKEERKARADKGQSTIADRVAGVFGKS